MGAARLLGMAKASAMAVAILLGLAMWQAAAPLKTEGLTLPHPADGAKAVEYFVRKPAGKGPWPMVVFLHGHQDGVRRGGQDFVTWGVLDKWSAKGYLAVAVSQPGYGRSSGPADFCGALSQRAVAGVIEKLVAAGDGVRGKVVIEGISRGAVVAGLLAQADPTIAGVVLVSGLYDLPEFVAAAETLPARSIAASMRSETGGEERELVARSLLRSSGKMFAKALILNGALDDRTNPEQARRLARQIEERGGAAQVIIYPQYGHQIPVAVRDAEIEPFIESVLRSWR
jgi:dipeptidyl aminopeptidase/acylaminoacyl peptidase